MVDTLCFADVDNLQKYNDDDHPAGDDVRKSVAGVIQSTLRELNYVGRYGGEEFVGRAD